jgi:flavin reductase (DIM6/NTAB) family NADH-FMN oxidoreductase RutF
MSYFNMVSHNPPTIMVSVMASATNSNGLKGTCYTDLVADPVDTAKNVRDTGEFCCSIISETFMEAASYTSIDSPADVEEWALAGLTKRVSQ